MRETSRRPRRVPGDCGPEGKEASGGADARAKPGVTPRVPRHASRGLDLRTEGREGRTAARALDDANRRSASPAPREVQRRYRRVASAEKTPMVKTTEKIDSLGPINAA